MTGEQGREAVWQNRIASLLCRRGKEDRMLKKLESIIYNVQRGFFIAVMTFMLLVLSIHVIMRFVFNSPIIWTDEVITMMQGTLAFAGIGYCFHKNQHTELSIVYDRVPRPVQHVFDLISNGVMLFCCIYMVKYSWAFTMQKNIPMNTIPWMKQSWIYCFITVGFVVAACYIVLRLVRVFQRIAGKDVRGE